MIDRDEVKGRIAGMLKQPAARLEDGMVLTDLVTDSFVLVEMVIELQEELRVRLVQDDLKDVKTVGDLAQAFVASARV